MKELERKYLKSLLIVVVILFAAAIFSFIYAIMKISENGDALDNTLELIYMAVHIITLVFAGSLVFKCLKTNKGSEIMKGLMVVPNTRAASKGARIVAIVLSSVGFLTGLYFTLVLCGVPLPYFHFPIALLLDLVNSPFTVFIVGLFFIFYPTIYKKSFKEEKKS